MTVNKLLGTGTNACYMETLENVELFHEDFPDVNQVVVNTELGAFGDNNVLYFIRTHWDEEVDSYSLNKGKQLYEMKESVCESLTKLLFYLMEIQIRKNDFWYVYGRTGSMHSLRSHQKTSSVWWTGITKIIYS